MLPGRSGLAIPIGSLAQMNRQTRILCPATTSTTPDANVNAARIVSESTRGEEQLPASVEAAWEAWSAHIQNVDQ